MQTPTPAAPKTTNTQTQELRKFIETNPQLVEIRKFPGVVRIDLEFFKTMGSKSAALPIFVVIANSNFRDRAKIPDEIDNIRLIVSYEESIEVAQVEKEAEEAAGPDNEEDSSDDEDEDMEEAEQEK